MQDVMHFVVYLGNFGPEISETLLAKHFDGPKMFVAAAEETRRQPGSGTRRCLLWYAQCKLQSDSFAISRHIFRSIRSEMQKNVQI